MAGRFFNVTLDPTKPGDRWKSVMTKQAFGAGSGTKLSFDKLKQYLERVNAYIEQLEEERRNHWDQQSRVIFGLADLDLAQFEALLLDSKVFPAPWLHKEDSVKAKEIPELAKIPCPTSEDDEVEVERLWSEYDNTEGTVADFYGKKAFAKANARLIVAIRNFGPRLIALARLGQESLKKT